MLLGKSSWQNSAVRRVAFVLFLSAGAAYQCRADIGGLPGAFLRFPVGARALAMGGAQTASPGDLCTWWDPAMLSTKRNTQIALGGGLMSLGRAEGYSSIEFKISPRVGMGFMPLYRGDPSLDNLYNENEEPLSSGSYSTPTSASVWLRLGLGALILTAGRWSCRNRGQRRALTNGEKDRS